MAVEIWFQSLPFFYYLTSLDNILNFEIITTPRQKAVWNVSRGKGLPTWLSIWITHPRATRRNRNQSVGEGVRRKNGPNLTERVISSGQHSQHWNRADNVRDKSKILNLVKTGSWARQITQVRAVRDWIWHFWHFTRVFSVFIQLLLT